MYNHTDIRFFILACPKKHAIKTVVAEIFMMTSTATHTFYFPELVIMIEDHYSYGCNWVSATENKKELK